MNHYRRTLSAALALALCLALAGCGAHSLGHKNVDGGVYAAAGQIGPGKAIHVALAEPLPPDLADTPSFITAQFCKYLASVASSVSAGEKAENLNAALAEARESKSDYLVYLSLREWKKGSMLAPGHKVDVEACVFDTATGDLLSRHQIEARC